MTEEALVALAGILGLGIAAQWLAWRLALPSIVLLLLVGVMAGPVFGLLDPDALFGDLLRPLVSFSVAVILFEGGLSLRLRDLRGVGLVVRNLVTVGMLVTWLVGGLGAYLILGLDGYTAALLGAILVVTGPTVILPLLQQVRPTGPVAAVLRWEGIVIDPVGAVVAILTFEVVLAGRFEGPGVAVANLLGTLFAGASLGGLAAAIMLLLLRHFWIPDYLQSSVALAAVIVISAAADLIQSEAGLVAVTVMGVVLANQSITPLRHIIEFKGNLGVLLLGLLFIILSARLSLDDLLGVGFEGVLYLLLLIVVARPLAVLVSTWGSELNTRERIFLSMMAPRGIVAASVASVAALQLREEGRLGGDRLVSLTFLIIIGTVIFYGFAARPLARRLGLSAERTEGVLMVGAHDWAREMAGALLQAGVRVRLVDTNRADIRAARLEGLDATYGSILSESLAERMDLQEFGRLLAVTPNDEVNALACLHFIDVFGRASVYQLPAGGIEPKKGVKEDLPIHLHGRTLFSEGATFRHLQQRFREGATLKVTNLTEEFDFDDFSRKHGGEATPLFVISESGAVQVASQMQPLAPKPGQKVISIVGGTANREPAQEALASRSQVRGEAAAPPRTDASPETGT